jgi:hypothetical protein
MAHEILQIPDWQELVARKRNECQEKIPREWILSDDLLKAPPHLIEYDIPRRSGMLSELELDLTDNYTASQLLAKLASGHVSSLALTIALCKRAAIAQQLVSCESMVIRKTSSNYGLDIMPHRDVLSTGTGPSSVFRRISRTRGKADRSTSWLAY